MMKEYYDVTKEGFSLIDLSYGSIAMLIVGSTYLLINYSNFERNKQIFTILWISVVSLMTIATILVSRSKYLSSINAMRDKRYEEIEGIVKNFDPQPLEGNKYESFTVKGVKFRVSHYDWCACFKKTKIRGGPIKQGKYVKIRYYEGEILQLWVRR